MGPKGAGYRRSYIHDRLSHTCHLYTYIYTIGSLIPCHLYTYIHDRPSHTMPFNPSAIGTKVGRGYRPWPSVPYHMLYRLCCIPCYVRSWPCYRPFYISHRPCYRPFYISHRPCYRGHRPCSRGHRPCYRGRRPCYRGHSIEAIGHAIEVML